MDTDERKPGASMSRGDDREGAVSATGGDGIRCFDPGQWSHILLACPKSPAPGPTRRQGIGGLGTRRPGAGCQGSPSARVNANF